MKNWTIALAGVIGLALLTVVMAAQPPGRGERPDRPGGPEGRGPGRGFRRPVMPLMAALDADKDGELSAKEIANAAKALKKLDKNNDGKVDRAELRPQFRRPDRPGGPGEPGGPRRPGGQGFVERMMGFDKNKDGKISKEEFPERMQRMFDRLDANKDGVVDKAELEEAAKRFGRGDRPPRGPGRGGDRPERPPRPERPDAE